MYTELKIQKPCQNDYIQGQISKTFRVMFLSEDNNNKCVMVYLTIL